MNILVIGRFHSEAFALHIAETLVAMGHVARRLELGLHYKQTIGLLRHRVNQVRSAVHAASDALPRVRARRLRSLWEEVEQVRPDVIIVCHDFLWPNEVAELKRRTGAAVGMWFPDSLVSFGKGFFMNAPYDAIFFKDPYIVHVLSGVLRSPVYYLPECFNPLRHRLPDGETISAEYLCEIATAGNSHSWRVACYNHLGKYDVKVWGPPAPLWMPEGVLIGAHQGRLVLNEDKARAFLGAKIVVNNLLYGEIWGLNARAFEAAGIGAFQLLDWRPGLAQLFEDGKEVISFRGMKDLLSKVDYWLKRPEERLAVARAGKKGAYAEHTYERRLSLLLDTLAGRAKAFPMPKVSTES